MTPTLRLAFVLLWNLLAALTWPLRALFRAALGHRAPDWVEVRIQHPLADFVRSEGWLRRRLGRRRDTSLEALRELFDRAHRSPRCKGLVLRIDDLQGSHAQLARLAQLIAGFRAPLDGSPGKEITVWAEGLSGRNYAALCGATRVHLPPGGNLDLTGSAVELTAAGAAFSMLGIRPEFFRREEHKTAPELFTRSEPSAVQREVANDLLDQGFDALLTSLSRRGFDRDRARVLVDRGPFLGRTGFEAGLLDKPLFWDEIVAERRPGSEALGSPRALRTSGRLAPSRFRSLRRPRAVGVIPLRGIIRSGKSGSFPGAGRFCGSDSLAAALEQGRTDPRLASLLLYIDSRGGSASASELMWREVCRAAKEKPVVVYVDGVAASGGYYAACGAKRILAAPLSIVGSIGVFYGRFELSEAFARLGIHRELLVRGDHAGLAFPTRPLLSHEREAADALVEAIYQDFIAVVAQGRGRKPEEIRPLAGGRIYTGNAAMKIGLVDRVATFEEALAEASKLGGLSTAKPPRIAVLEESASGPAALAALGGSIQSLVKPQAFAYHLGTQWAES